MYSDLGAKENYTVNSIIRFCRVPNDQFGIVRRGKQTFVCPGMRGQIASISGRFNLSRSASFAMRCCPATGGMALLNQWELISALSRGHFIAYLLLQGECGSNARYPSNYGTMPSRPPSSLAPSRKSNCGDLTHFTSAMRSLDLFSFQKQMPFPLCTHRQSRGHWFYRHAYGPMESLILFSAESTNNTSVAVTSSL